MLRLYYQRRLARDLPRWADRGWVDPVFRDAILADAAEAGPSSGAVPFLLAVLGGLLLTAGALLLVAANWQEIPRIGKLAIVLTALWTAYAAAYGAARSGAERFAEALMLLGVLLYGVGILLVAQILQLPADLPQGLLIWSLGALLATWLWPSELAAALTLVLLALWTTLVVQRTEALIHWPFLGLWAAVALPVVLRRWTGATHAALVTLAWWIVLMLGTLNVNLGASFGDVLRLGAAIAAALVALAAALPPRADLAGFVMLTERYALVALIALLSLLLIPWIYADEGIVAAPVWPLAALGVLVPAAVAALAAFLWRDGDALAGGAVGMAALVLAATQLPDDYDWLAVVVLNIVLIAALIGLIVLGFRRDDRFLVNLGFLFFAVTVLRIYADTFWMLFDRALFFILGGALVIALGWFLERRRRQMVDELGKAP